jgi:hypothetical protein
VTVDFAVHFLDVPAATLVGYRGQVSRDGISWVDVPGLAFSTSASGASRQRAAIEGPLLRFALTSQPGAGPGGASSARVDLRASLHRA